MKKTMTVGVAMVFLLGATRSAPADIVISGSSVLNSAGSSGPKLDVSYLVMENWGIYTYQYSFSIDPTTPGYGVKSFTINVSGADVYYQTAYSEAMAGLGVPAISAPTNQIDFDYNVSGGVQSDAVYFFSIYDPQELTFDSLSFDWEKANAPVPEPSTVIAGALMLLPLGAGVVRALCKKRAV